MRDDELFQRMAAGDAEACEALVARYYDEIFRYCLWHAPRQALAEDATQEVFLKFIRYAPRAARHGNHRALLYQIARHTCIDMARRHYLSEAPLEQAPEHTAPDPGFAETESAHVLREIVAHLPEAQRELVLLRFAQDLTLREIASVTGLPLRTVQSRLRAALKILRRDFEKGDFL